MSIADELKKLKELLDSGVLSQEEFDAEKEKLLDSDGETTDVDKLEEAVVDEKTGEASCPKCGSTKLKARRNKALIDEISATIILQSYLAQKR